MQFISTKLQGCFLIQSEKFTDSRGSFSKIYHSELFEKNMIDFTVREQFYTVSNKNVLRGMHFQLPPYSHSKLVCCLTGKALDVILDLRKNSPTYQQYDFFDLEQNDGQVLHLPSGVAHGFLSLEDNTGMLYSTSTVHVPEFDYGIHWNSFGFDWHCANPVVSERDKKHPILSNFSTPF